MSDTLGDVQKILIKHLENFIGISNETSLVLSPGKRTAADGRNAHLKQKIHDVENLQIRMTIVAPMKTGKSTILNAIIGDEVLPIHDEAMTALPTEIVLQYSDQQHAVGEPCLYLTDTCRNILNKLQECVYAALGKCFNSLENNLNYHSHLIATAQKMYSRDDIPGWSAEKITGSENINKCLCYINDLVHIFVLLHPSNVSDSDDQSPITLLTKLAQNIPSVRVLNPVSETPSLVPASSIVSRPYSLLLVDTPGPNEQATSDRLKEILEEEIRKADIVLVALDYTALGTEADAKIAEAVRKVRDIKDPNYVYAVVNKVDQRQENGKSTEDVRKHIAIKYEICEENVFELKARYGLMARKYRAARNSSLKNEEPLRIKQSTAARNVLRQFYPIDFEAKIDKIELDELDKLAEQLYNISGIHQLLESAIDRIKGEIIHRCIESAFRIGTSIYRDLQRDIRLHSRHSDQKAEALTIELDKLRRDQEAIRDLEENFDDDEETEHVLSTFKNKLQSTFTKARGTIIDDMKNFFSENNRRWLDLTKWRAYLYTKRSKVSVGGATAAVTGLFISIATGVGIAVAGVAALGVYYHSSDVLEFDKYDDAVKFRDHVTKESSEISIRSCNMISEQVHTTCKNALQQIQCQCKRKIHNILGEAEQRVDR